MLAVSSCCVGALDVSIGIYDLCVCVGVQVCWLCMGLIIPELSVCVFSKVERSKGDENSMGDGACSRATVPSPVRSISGKQEQHTKTGLGIILSS